jgi:hypothetical protein
MGMIMWQKLSFFIGLCLCCLQASGHQSDSVQGELRISHQQDFSLTLKLNYLHLYAELLGFDKADKQALTQLNDLDTGQRNDLMTRFNDQFKREFTLVDAHGAAVDYQLQSLPPHQLQRMLQQKLMYGRSDLKNFTISGHLPLEAGRIEINFPNFIGTVKLRRIEESRYVLPPSLTTTQIWADASATPSGSDNNAYNNTYNKGQEFWGYISSGFIHIVPLGLDHILFMLGFFLLSRRFKTLLLQLSVFTLAHSITLGLASVGWQPIPSNIVEPLIALSIVWVAVENLLAKQQIRFRLLVIFVFGLLHGLGFASVFLDTQPTSSTLLSQLIGFNLGVELGQILVVGLAFIATYWLQQHVHYRRWVVVPGSTLIALIAGFWTIQRLMVV